MIQQRSKCTAFLLSSLHSFDLAAICCICIITASCVRGSSSICKRTPASSRFAFFSAACVCRRTSCSKRHTTGGGVAVSLARSSTLTDAIRAYACARVIHCCTDLFGRHDGVQREVGQFHCARMHLLAQPRVGKHVAHHIGAMSSEGAKTEQEHNSSDSAPITRSVTSWPVCTALSLLCRERLSEQQHPVCLLSEECRKEQSAASLRILSKFREGRRKRR